MNQAERITEKLQGEAFEWKNERFTFLSCKQVASNLMILTNVRTLQISIDKVDEFLNDFKLVPAKKEFVPAVQNVPRFIPEVPATFQKLNESFESLISQLETANTEDLPLLEAKAKMLTSIGQTAVNMENSKINFVKALQGK